MDGECCRDGHVKRFGLFILQYARVFVCVYVRCTFMKYDHFGLEADGLSRAQWLDVSAIVSLWQASALWEQLNQCPEDYRERHFNAPYSTDSIKKSLVYSTAAFCSIYLSPCFTFRTYLLRPPYE